MSLQLAPIPMMAAPRAEPGPPPRSAPAYLPVLDGVRGLAILLVFVVHYASAEIDPSLLEGSFVQRLWSKIAVAGTSGVGLFFVLSGYLITRILLADRGAPRYLRSFYTRRVLRIFPLYYLALLLVFVILPLAGAPVTPEVARVRGDQAWMWLYLSNFASAFLDVRWNGGWIQLEHFWSLSVEEHFYLFWPFLVLWLSERRLLQVCLGLGLGSLVLRLVIMRLGLDGHFVSWEAGVYKLTPSRLDGLSLGAALAVLDRSGGLAAWRGRARVALAVSGALLASLVVASHASPLLWWTTAAVHSVWSVFYAAFLLLVLQAGQASLAARVVGHGVLRFFGRYSYGLYVFHYMMRPQLTAWLRPERLQAALGSRILGLWLFAAIALAISTAVALVSWHLVEKHLLKLKPRHGGRA